MTNNQLRCLLVIVSLNGVDAFYGSGGAAPALLDNNDEDEDAGAVVIGLIFAGIIGMCLLGMATIRLCCRQQHRVANTKAALEAATIDFDHTEAAHDDDDEYAGDDDMHDANNTSKHQHIEDLMLEVGLSNPLK